MAVVQPRRSLYVPGQGEVSLEQKDVVPINRNEVVMLSWLHEFAHKHQVNIFCKRCEQPISGQNNDSTAKLSVACQCREFVYSGG